MRLIQRKLWVAICGIAMLAIIVILALSAFGFQTLSGEETIRTISADNSGVIYYLTNDGNLYVSGSYRSRSPLYENMNFRWKFLYGIRSRLLGLRDPVLLASSVTSITPGDAGAVFLDTAGFLWYIGEFGDSGPELIAPNGKTAYVDHGTMVCVFESGELAEYVSSETGWKQIASVRSRVCKAETNGIRMISLTEDGELYQDTTSQADAAPGILIDTEVSSFRNIISTLYYCKENGELRACHWDALISPPSKSVSLCTDAAEIIAADEAQVIYFDADGNIRLQERSPINDYRDFCFSDAQILLDSKTFREKEVLCVTWSKGYLFFACRNGSIQKFEPSRHRAT